MHDKTLRPISSENSDSIAVPVNDFNQQWITDAEILAEIGCWVYNPTTDREYWSPGLRKIVKCDPTESAPVLFEYVSNLEETIASFLKSKVPFCSKKFIHRTSEETSILLFHAEKRCDPSGNLSDVLATFQNISGIVWTFGVPGMGDQLLQAILSSDDVLVVAVNDSLTMTYVEGGGWRELGIVPEELIGENLTETYAESPGISEAYRKTLQGNDQNIYFTFKGRYYAAMIRQLLGPEGSVAGAISFAIDITDRNIILKNLERGNEILEETVRKRTAELRNSETMLQSVLATSNAGIVIMDTEHRITYANAACHGMFGFNTEELYGHNVGEFLMDETYRALCHALLVHEGSPRGITHFRHQIPIRKKNDEEIWVDVNAALTCDDKAKPERLIAVMFDITEQHLAMNRLQEAKLASEAASSAKSQFLAHMSHEIRTPLNGVIGLADLLMGTDLTTKQTEYAGLIKISGKSLLFLINDILDFSKIEAGKLEIEEEEFDLITTVESVLGILATRASDKGLELCGSFSSNIPRFVRGDSGRLRQVLINLVGNALKFTQEGGVKLQVIVERTTLSPIPCDNDAMNDEILIRFSVIDTGIGISEEGIPKLFQSFSQVDNSSARRHDGTGLGLAISQRLVTLMKGELKVESVPEQGSVFWFMLPFACRIDIKECPAQLVENAHCDKSDSGAQTAKCPRLGVDECPLGRRRVMHGSVPLSDRLAIVVDDNGIQRDALAEQLTSWGMDVSKAASRDEAMELLLQAAETDAPYQLAIIDSSIADGEGMDLVEAMKAEPKLVETAIILLTPLTVDTDIAVIHSAGVSMHVSKPVFSSSLFDATITALFSKGRTKLEAEGNPENVDERAVSEGYDERRSLIRILVAEDNRINQIVVRDTLENVGFQCHVVGNGLLAVEAIRDEHFDVILMDCQMPEMDGFEATNQIRQQETDDLYSGKIHRRIPIIALTANATKDDEARCLSSGMDAYCSKPINPKALIRTIDQWIKPILMKRISERPGELTAPFPIKTFLTLCGKNKLIATMVLSDFLNQIPRDLTTLETAIQESDFSRAVPTLQHLRGKAGLLSAADLEKRAAELEVFCVAPDGADCQRMLDLLFDEANRCMQYAAKAKQKIDDDAG